MCTADNSGLACAPSHPMSRLASVHSETQSTVRSRCNRCVWNGPPSPAGHPPGTPHSRHEGIVVGQGGSCLCWPAGLLQEAAQLVAAGGCQVGKRLGSLSQRETSDAMLLAKPTMQSASILQATTQRSSSPHQASHTHPQAPSTHLEAHPDGRHLQLRQCRARCIQQRLMPLGAAVRCVVMAARRATRPAAARPTVAHRDRHVLAEHAVAAGTAAGGGSSGRVRRCGVTLPAGLFGLDGINPAGRAVLLRPAAEAASSRQAAAPPVQKNSKHPTPAALHPPSAAETAGTTTPPSIHPGSHSPLPPRLPPSGIAGLHSRRPCRPPPAVCRLLGRSRHLLLLLLLWLRALLLQRCRACARRRTVGRCRMSTAAASPWVQLGCGLGPWKARRRSALCPLPARPLGSSACRRRPPAPLVVAAAAAGCCVAAPGEQPAQEAVAPGPLRHAAGLLPCIAATCGSGKAAKPVGVQCLIELRARRRRRGRQAGRWRQAVWGWRRLASIHQAGSLTAPCPCWRPGWGAAASGAWEHCAAPAREHRCSRCG